MALEKKQHTLKYFCPIMACRKLLFLALAALVITSSDAQTNCDYADNCDETIGYLSSIECSKLPGQECGCNAQSGNCDWWEELDPKPTAADLHAKCKQLCEDSSESTDCFFWKWSTVYIQISFTIKGCVHPCGCLS